MNISYNWLKDLVEISLPPKELAKKLTDVGLAVEGIHEFGDDFVFDIDLTSNRGDCLSHLGVAREISVITDSKFQISNFKLEESSESGTQNSRLVKIEDTDLCHRFTARVIRGVKIGASPEWLVKRLEAVGERSINNVADITNFVMHELGNPMHSFDLNKLAGNRIVVRRANLGETIKTLDEVERKPDETMLMICDAEKPVAVGGVMGGFDSSITDETTDVLLEVAYFDRDSIRQTSRKLKLSTEASHHFERGVDVENLIRTSNRATELICELAGGTADEFADVYPTKFVQNEIEAKDIQFAVKRLTGLEVEKDEILRILSALGLKTQDAKLFTIPTWRHDIAIEEDLVEEVARIVGYDKIGEELPPAFGAGEYQPTEKRKKQLRKTLTDFGFNEAISYSFIDTKMDDAFELVPNLPDENSNDKFITLQDSVIEGAVRMRPSLLSGLLDAVRINFNQQNKNLRLFELGKVFAASSNEDKLPIERELFAIVLSGGEVLENRAVISRELDFYDLKGAIESALDSVGIINAEFSTDTAKHLQKGQTASVSVNGKKIGFLGRLSDEIAANYKFKQAVYIGEIDLQTVLAEARTPVLYHPLPKFPASLRDISLLAKRSVSFDAIKNTISESKPELLQSVAFVDVYEGKGIADDERSITIRLEYRNNERTLTDEEVDKVHAQILAELENKTGAKLRL
jgi:phenylalanyl-tRNA synthetase beta chain